MIRRNARRRRRGAPAAKAAVAAPPAAQANAPAQEWGIVPVFISGGSAVTDMTTNRKFVAAGIPQNWRLHKGGIGGPVRIVTSVSVGSPTTAGIHWSGDGAATLNSVITIGQQDPGLRGVQGGHMAAGTYHIG